MGLYELSAIILYFSLLFLIGFSSYRKNLSSSDFILGSRSLNYWLTAMSAHASDMSSWLFLAYPALIFTDGIFKSWAAIGLTVFMFLNWQLVATKIRVSTEKYNSLTFSSFFESRLSDTSGTIRIFTAVMSLVFYTIYLSAGLVGLGILLETLFGINYFLGVFLGIALVIPYVFIGGYLTLAWIDLFQGIFLLGVILFVPLYLLPKVGGLSSLFHAASAKHLPTSLFPDLSYKSLWLILCEMLGWGLGYFGQPHIITKFMGIKKTEEIRKSKWVGMTWMVLSLGAAVLVGLVGIAYFTTPLDDPQQLFIAMVRQNFHPFLIGFILCGILATTINSMSSQVLVLSSTLTEDFYRKVFNKNASTKELLLVSRIGIILVALLAFGIAYGKVSTIYSLVFYAWSGLGASFGPVILLCLYSKKTNKFGAWGGILAGGSTAALWPYINQVYHLQVPPIIPAFALSFLTILAVSRITNPKAIPGKLENIS